MSCSFRPALRDLTIHVIPSVTTKWYELGVVLLDPEYQNELSTIELDTRNDVKTCCRKMFTKWLNTDELASWNKLIKALKILQLNDVANSIEQLVEQGEYSYLYIVVQYSSYMAAIMYISFSVPR